MSILSRLYKLFHPAPTVVVTLEHGHGSDSHFPSKLDDSGLTYKLRSAMHATLGIAPGGCAVIPCGFTLELPRGYVALVRPIYQLAWKHRITATNATYTADTCEKSFTVVVENHGSKNFTVNYGDLIGQMVIVPAVEPVFELVKEIV